MKLTIEGCAG